ncbi:pterin-4-alpha-carbinolamine dehydratase [Mariprofundus ferrinatatus]|uniref:Putative pterin-4-alpha-carbinolamine dehydratase n=1 Tax=Mariprofundus ferrinatatus TaxID=1921087 RepID=A0A2K8L5N3_9PROT|nr:4a-hydroxytetrahydrobiopterin dehydratase [Mariprofundus ferrinatatus]ATX82597.1 pterin-4-alpha-carbinolamine dehydratase [Mariprofundus ferrinatatus]
MSPENLQNKSCMPCKGGVAPMDRQDAERMLIEIRGWELSDDARQLRRTVTFSNFVDAQLFATTVGELSESEGHHPDISFGWGYCTITFYTHKIGGLHENDFIMAAKVNSLMK